MCGNRFVKYCNSAGRAFTPPCPSLSVIGLSAGSRFVEVGLQSERAEGRKRERGDR